MVEKNSFFKRGKQYKIDCFINNDTVYLKSKNNKTVFNHYEIGNLEPMFAMWTKCDQTYIKLFFTRNECEFGNSELFKETRPELFI